MLAGPVFNGSMNRNQPRLLEIGQAYLHKNEDFVIAISPKKAVHFDGSGWRFVRISSAFRRCDVSVEELLEDWGCTEEQLDAMTKAILIGGRTPNDAKPSFRTAQRRRSASRSSFGVVIERRVAGLDKL